MCVWACGNSEMLGSSKQWLWLTRNWFLDAEWVILWRLYESMKILLHFIFFLIGICFCLLQSWRPSLQSSKLQFNCFASPAATSENTKLSIYVMHIYILKRFLLHLPLHVACRTLRQQLLFMIIFRHHASILYFFSFVICMLLCCCCCFVHFRPSSYMTLLLLWFCVNFFFFCDFYCIHGNCCLIYIK